MGLFDGISKALSNALANEDLPPPTNEGFSQVQFCQNLCASFITRWHGLVIIPERNVVQKDSWLGGVKKSIVIQFVQNGELKGQTTGLPGDKISDLASRYFAIYAWGLLYENLE